MRVLIITEGSKEIGFGHITRCMSLYQAFNEINISVRFIVNGDSVIESILKNIEYQIFNWLKYPDKFFKLLKKSDIIIIDSYLTDERFYKKISELGEFAVYIDDNKRIEYPKGVVINGSILASELNYAPQKEVKFLLGSHYIPLRREFWNVEKKEINRTVESVLVTFGGDDLRNMTPSILKMLIHKYPQLIKNVVIGRGFGNITEIENLKDARTNLIYYPDADEMLNLMLESDIAISGGGQTLYELARVGVPTIAIGIASNQLHNLNNWQKVGFIELAGFWDDKKLYDNIKDKLELIKRRVIRLKKSRISKKYVDGMGSLRIVKYVLNEYYTNKINLRPLKFEDMKDIYELSNEDEVRENSFNTEKIEFTDHEKWFNEKLEDKKCVFLVLEIDGDFAGQVRFNLLEYEATISISITKKYREKGLGANILKNSLKYLKENLTSIKIVKAYIKENNHKSIKDI